MKKWLTIILLGLVLLPSTAQAKNIYYTNDNGVSFSKEEYDLLTNLFWEGSQDLFTMSDYERFVAKDLMNGDFDMVVLEEPMPLATSITDKARTFKIGKVCSDDCFVSVTLQWTQNPTVRSYDVIGFLLDGTTITGIPSTNASSSTNSNVPESKRTFSNGFGASIKLPSGSGIIISQVFDVEKKGTVYASYQHATMAISLENSKKYTLSKTGFGGVFEFTGLAYDTYDRMNGLTLSMV